MRLTHPPRHNHRSTAQVHDLGAARRDTAHSTRDSQRAAQTFPYSGRKRRRLLPAALTVALIVAVVVLGGSVAHADTPQMMALAGSVGQVLTNIRNWVMGILAGLATVFLTLGGVRYVMGGGDPGEIEKAKTSFKAAGIGYGLAALAPLVVSILQGIVGA